MREAVRAGGALLLLFSLGSAVRAAPAASSDLGDGSGFSETVEVRSPGDVPPAESPLERDPTADVTQVSVKDQGSAVTEVPELLRQVPGVVMHEVGGAGQAGQVSIRGASATGVAVYLDGIPLNGAGGVADVSLVPTTALDRVEVLRGGGSLFGSGALGGVVNLVSRAPEAGLHLFGELSGGSFGTELAQAGTTGSALGGTGLLLVNVLHTDGDFPYVSQPYVLVNGPSFVLRRVHNEAARGEALGKLEETVGRWKLGTLLEAAAVARGLAGTVDNPTDDFQHTQRVLAGVRATRELPADASLSLRAFLRWQADTFQGRDLGGWSHQVETVGGVEAEGAKLWGRHRVLASVTGTLDGLRVEGGAHPSWAEVSLVAQDTWRAPGDVLRLVPAVRLDRVGPFLGAAPKLGLAAELPHGFSSRMNAGLTFRAPSFLELYVAQGQVLPNPELQPERGMSADVQLEHRSRHTHVGVTGFGQLTSNLIAYEYYGFLRARPRNFSTASVLGLESEAAWTPWEFLRLSGNYTWMVSRDLLDDAAYYGHELPNRPRHSGFVELWGGAHGLSAHVRLLGQSEQFLNRGNKLALPARAFVQAGLAADLPGVTGVQVAFEVKNLLDTHSADFDGYPLPGRAYYLTLRVALDRVPKERT